MASHLVVLALIGSWLVYLVVERVRLVRDREKVPLRIAVTGTRGKTTVTRRLAAVLSEDGRRVLTKTTGSEAAYLLPDGTVQEIHRLGPPSIIEQKRFLRRGAKMGVDVALAEVMSLHRENHRVELHEILRPHLVLVTNFRVDHTEAQGSTREEVASVLALDVPRGATALVPEEEWDEGFAALVSQAGGEVVRVPAGDRGPVEAWRDFGPNLDLVRAAAESLGVDGEAIRAGLAKAQDDVGALRTWSYRRAVRPGESGEPGGAGESGEPGGAGPEDPGKEWLLVSAFAANDPESTMAIFDRIAADRGVHWKSTVGLLTLRADRGDRSLQWVEALKEGALSRFGRLLVSGAHAPALRFALRRHPAGKRIEILKPGPPDEIMDQLMGEAGEGGALRGSREAKGAEEDGGPLHGKGTAAGTGAANLIFGFGNMEGLGRTMVRHWRKIGESHGV